LAYLDAAVLDGLIAAFMWTRTHVVDGRRVIAIDGKTVRGARTLSQAAPHLAAALDHATGAVVGQIAVDMKSNADYVFTVKANQPTLYAQLKVAAVEGRPGALQRAVGPRPPRATGDQGSGRPGMDHLRRCRAGRADPPDRHPHGEREGKEESESGSGVNADPTLTP
jgi:hypothetical protein